jgi:phage gp29-like protein
MNFSLEWFLNFTQLFGQPSRWATYDPDMDEADQVKLQLFLQQMGSSAWGMFPEGTKLDYREAVTQGKDNPQLLLTELANKAARTLILRQSLTSDTGSKGSGSLALGKVHEGVLDDVKLGCGQWACEVLDQLIRYIAVLNFGNDDECPSAKVIVPDEESSLTASETAANLSAAGIEPDDDALLALGKKVGFSIRRKNSPAPAAVASAGSDILAARHRRADSLGNALGRF